MRINVNHITLTAIEAVCDAMIERSDVLIDPIVVLYLEPLGSGEQIIVSAWVFP